MCGAQVKSRRRHYANSTRIFYEAPFPELIRRLVEIP